MDIDAKDYEALEKILQFEQSTPEREWSLGWDWSQVGLYTGVINRLIVRGYVNRTFNSRSSKYYRLTDKGKEVAGLQMSAGTSLGEAETADTFTENIVLGEVFADIVGYSDVKELLKESLQLDKPIHVLLHGPPSICKSKFLLDIEQAAGPTAIPLLGSATSHMGLWDLIAERKPRYLLIDEIEKLPLADMAGLLSLMEQGRIIRTKVGRRLDEKLSIWVIAAANKINKLPPELLSRFAKFYLKEYDANEYVTVVKSVLVHQEDLSESNACILANT